MDFVHLDDMLVMLQVFAGRRPPTQICVNQGGEPGMFATAGGSIQQASV
jgi:hypothetical protein